MTAEIQSIYLETETKGGANYELSRHISRMDYKSVL